MYRVIPVCLMLQATTKLEVQKDTGKIISHVEVWHNKSVSGLFIWPE
jgi:hypothetical protein